MLCKKTTYVGGLLFISLFTFFAHNNYAQSSTKIEKTVTIHTDESKITDRPIVTIYIHGTFFTDLYETFFGKNFYRPSLFGSPYAYNTNGLYGLFKATDIAESEKNLPHEYQLSYIANKCSETSPHNFPLEYFYIYRWSGTLRTNDRKNASQELYTALKKLILEYKATYNTAPFIRILSHSHGGNIALHLADYIKQEDNLAIDELILIACPVQDKTRFKIHSVRFKNIYAIYSSADTTQTLDPQGFGRQFFKGTPVFSGRQFQFDQKLKQVNLTINRHALSHVDFLYPFSFSCIPPIIKEMNTWFAQQPGIKNETRTLHAQTNS